MGRVLRIRTADAGESERDSDEFVIEDPMVGADADRYDDLYERFVTSDLESNVDPPLIHLLDYHVTTAISYDGEPLVHLYLVYEHLAERIEREGPDRLECEALPERYKRVVMDVADEYGLSVEFQAPLESDPSPVSVYLSILFGLVPFLLNQMLALVLNVVRTTRASDIVFVPGRPKSMSPILAEAACRNLDFSVVTAELSVKRVLSALGLQYGFENILRDSTVEQYDPTPIDAFTTLSTVRRQIRFCFVDVLREVVLDRRFESQLNDFLRTELDADMARTVRYALDELYTPYLFREIAHGSIMAELIDRGDCEAVVVGTLSPFGRVVARTAMEGGVSVYHVPHSITVPYTPVIPRATKFVEGAIGEEYIDEHIPVGRDASVVSAGRPYLKNLHEEHDEDGSDEERSNGDSTSSPSRMRIVIATQQYGWGIDRRFVEYAVQGIEQLESETSTVIKVHPDEDPGYYEAFESDSITVATGDITEYMTDADLVVVLNSNVGAEAMIVGTPCVCINPWAPMIRLPTYAEQDPVPALRSREEVLEFFGQLDAVRLGELRTEQTAFVREMFEVEERAAVEIVDHIVADLRPD